MDLIEHSLQLIALFISPPSSSKGSSSLPCLFAVWSRSGGPGGDEDEEAERVVGVGGDGGGGGGE